MIIEHNLFMIVNLNMISKYELKMHSFSRLSGKYTANVSYIYENDEDDAIMEFSNKNGAV